ncbi:hypothetical protein ACL2XP_17985 [Sodalis sp. RH21]|uniref:hypothetical protein n=1 Tax=unclassified Sodalis (in: enterobacteria) TaxID=2636512 RepID=UPI0039B370A2
MNITYEDICKQRQNLDEKRQERKAKLQRDAGVLLASYQNSLSLEKPFWVDSRGQERPIVSTVYLNEKNLFEQQSFAALRLDENNRITFCISTVVHPGPNRGDYYLVTVAMWYEEGILRVVLNEGESDIAVTNPEKEDSFLEVNNVIKLLIMSSFIDPRLD